jgi:ribonuclease VapC
MKVLIKLDGAIVDSSPIVSIFENRSSALAFRQGLERATSLYMSAGTLMELSVIFMGQKATTGVDTLDELLNVLKIKIVPLDASMVIDEGRYGCSNYGKGHNPASLNMGDLFSYSLAKKMKLPLFFEGKDFHQTDIQDAMSLLGYVFDDKHSPSIPFLK